jgi:hypothetical protein
VEKIIYMIPYKRKEVESGEMTSCFRPGHRDFRLGPATIVFRQDNHAVGSPIDVYITEVVHTKAQDRELAFSEALVRLGVRDEVEDKVTRISWALH